MSGHSGFMPIGGPGQLGVNIVNNVNVADNVQEVQPGAGNVVQAPDVHSAAEKSLKASSLVKELDALLLKAASKARVGISGADMEKIAGDAKLNQATATKLKSAASIANRALLKLDGFTGADLAKAMVKNAEGEVVWDLESEAGCAVRDAMDAQENLSAMLNEAINKLPKKASASAQAALEEAMMQADRRMGEIDTLVMQITEIAEIGIDSGKVDFETEERLNRKMGELAGEKALAMHDNNRALKAVKATIDPIVARIDAYMANKSAVVPPGEPKTFIREVGAARNAIANAAKTGVVKLPNDQGVKVDVFVDRKFLDEAAKLVEEAANRLGNLRVSVGVEATKKFIENDMPWFEDPIFSPQLSSKLRAIAPDKLGFIASVAAGLGNLRIVMNAVAEAPNERTAGRLRQVGSQLTDRIVEGAVRELKSGALAKNPPKEDAPDDVKQAYKEFMDKCAADKDYINNLCYQIRHRLLGINAAVEHVIQMAWKAHHIKDEAYRSSETLLSVFRGDRCFSSLVESRVHGYADGDINAELDDVNVESSKELGSGNFNTVTLVKFKNGSEYVFKPEMSGRLAANFSPLQAEMDDEQQITKINGAVQKTADALGLDDVMVKTTAGTHKGRFGMFMEKAPGVSAANFRDGVGDRPDEPVLRKDDIVNLPDADYEKVVGRMMRQCNRLQWFDVITGQGDRHANNYMVEVRPDLSVPVKGIDNDASYGVFRIGMMKFRITNEKPIERFNNELQKYASLFGERAKEVYDELRHDPAVQDSHGEIIVDLAKAKSPVLSFFVRVALGAKTLAVPQDIDKDLYDKLIALKGGTARKEHLRNLRDRLGGDDTPEYAAAVQRLDDAILYAMKLNEAGRVYTKEQWETKDIQRAVVSHGVKFNGTQLGGKATILDDKKQKFYIARVKSTLSNNLFIRDIMDGIERPGWFSPLKDPAD